MEFTKMQGTGNGYVYTDCFEETVRGPTKIVIYVSDRHFGIGSDGLILTYPSRIADHRIEICDVDGSQRIICSSGVCCMGRYVYDHSLADRDKGTVTVETLAGTKMLELEIEDGKAVFVAMDMGEVALISRLPEDITVDGEGYWSVGINVGDPHTIYHVNQVDCLDLEWTGPAFENHGRFAPDRMNTEFIHVADRKHPEMRVWERGSGEVWACGAGATANVMASILIGYMEDETEMALCGGELVVRYEEESGHLFMTGPAVKVFRGSIDISEEIYYD